MGPPPAPTTRRIVPLVALVGAALLLAHPSLAAVAGSQTAGSPQPSNATHVRAVTTASPTPQPECAPQDRRPESPDTDASYHYVDGLTATSTANWTAGKILRIGVNGACSLGVSDNTTATLTATTVNASRGTVTGVLDVGRGGAFRVVEHAERNATASVAIENIGRENSDRVAIVATNASGTVAASERVTVPTGRFFAVEIRWYPNETAQVTLWAARGQRPGSDRVTRTVPTSVHNASWQVQLDGRAYLDEIAVGTRDVATANGEATEQSSASATQTAPPAEQNDESGTPEMFTFNPEDEQTQSDESRPGLVFGPLMAIGGVLVYRYAYGITKFNEQLDAIGSKTRSADIEPADWNVMLTKLTGAASGLVGLLWFLTAVLGL